MATLAAANGCGAAVMIVLAVTTSGASIPLLLVAAFAAAGAAWLATSSVTISSDALIIRNGSRSRVIVRASIEEIGVTTVKRTKLRTVGVKLDGANVGVSCLQRLPTSRSRAALANQALVLLTGRLDGDRSVPWGVDAVDDDAWQVFEQLVLAAHSGRVEKFSALARTTADLPARTAGRLSIYVLVLVADLVTERVGPVRDPDVLDALNSQLRPGYAELFPGEEYGVRHVLDVATEVPAKAAHDATVLLARAGAAVIGCLLGDNPYAELARMRTKMSGWLLTHAAELPAHVLVPTRIYAD